MMNRIGQWLLKEKNETSLKDNNKDSTFECQQSETYSQIRLRQTGKNLANDDYLVLSYLDFGGFIIPNKSQ